MTRSSLLDSLGDSTALSTPPFIANTERDVVLPVAADVAVPNPQDVEGYLEEHSALQLLLPQICQRVREEFGPDAELLLELYRDPEIDDRYLTLEVRQERYDSNIIERLDQISGEFADELEPCSGQILLTTDFGPPRMNNAV